MVNLDPLCKTSWSQLGTTQTCYMEYNTNAIDWHSAQKSCEDKKPSANLVVFSNYQETFQISLYKEPFWIGVKQNATGHFVDMYNRTLPWTKWAKSEPAVPENSTEYCGVSS